MADAVLGLHTVEDFEKFIDSPENRNRLLELIHGVIVEKMPTEEHGMLAGNIVRLLGNHVIPNNLGKVGVEIRHHKSSDKYNVRMPDVSFRRGSEPPMTKGAVQQMPDLAVEIQSPDDKLRDMREKAHYYLQNGAQLVWLVYPRNRIIEVCTLNTAGEIEVESVGAEGKVHGGSVLPGFELSLQEIFAVV